jgi:hypothetical protein
MCGALVSIFSILPLVHVGQCFSCLGIIPHTFQLLGVVTDELSLRVGKTLSRLINATLVYPFLRTIISRS